MSIGSRTIFSPFLQIPPDPVTPIRHEEGRADRAPADDLFMEDLLDCLEVADHAPRRCSKQGRVVVQETHHLEPELVMVLELVCELLPSTPGANDEHEAHVHAPGSDAAEDETKKGARP